MIAIQEACYSALVPKYKKALLEDYSRFSPKH